MKLQPLSKMRTAEILLVEDNDDDVFLTREALNAAKSMANLHHVDNGAKCLQFLRRQGQYAEAPVPDLILLDSHMPGMSGYEVMAEIVRDEKLRHLPVVVLTTSSELVDIRRMYGLRCSSYVAKPVDFDEFVKMVGVLVDYWLTVVIVPGAGN